MNYNAISYYFMQSIAILQPKEVGKGKGKTIEIEPENIERLKGFNFDIKHDTDIKVYTDKGMSYFSKEEVTYIEITGNGYGYKCTVDTIYDVWKRLRTTIPLKIRNATTVKSPYETDKKLIYKLEQNIRQNYGQKGYWKQSIVMKLSYTVKSLKLAWQLFKQVLSEMPINKLTSLFTELRKTGKIFSATFVKKDNTIREINCRLGVKKGLNGQGMRFNPIEKGLIPVYDMQKEGYRMININTLQELTFEGQTYQINELLKMAS